MRVLIVAGSLVADGMGRFAHDLATAVATAGDTVTLIAPAAEHTLELPANVRIVWVKPQYRMRSLIALCRYVATVIRFERDADVVHFATDYPNYILAAAVLTKPYLITAHGTYSIVGATRGVRRFLVRYVFRKAAAVHAVSAYTAKRLAASVRGIKRIQVIHHGIVQASRLKQQRPIELPERFIFSAGAVKPRKGLHIALQAFAGITKEFPEMSYLIAGALPATEYVDELHRLISQHHLENKVRFLGHVTDAEREMLFEHCLLYVQPSITETTVFEGYGIVFLEAGSFGKAVLATLGSGIEDAVLQGQTGILVPQDDLPATTEALRTLLRDEALRHRMGAANYAHAMNHDWKQLVHAFKELYASVVTIHSPHGHIST